MATLPCPVVAFTKADMLALCERILPAHYLSALKSPGPGYEVLEALAALFARCSTAVELVGCGSLITSAEGGLPASGTVELYRAAPIADGTTVVVVKAGTVVQASASGRTFVTTADVTFAPLVLGPFQVAVQAVAQGAEYNLPGAVLAVSGDTLEGEIDTVLTLIEEPAMGDVSIAVRQVSATTGGADAYLDAHGADRGVLRGLLESDASYRSRIRVLPDNISPDAFDRALQRLLTAYGAAYQLSETWDVAYQTCWDAPSATITGSNYDPNLFCFDDPRLTTVFRNRWLDENDYRGGVVVVLPALAPIADSGMAYDDTAMDAADLANPLGSRAVGAFDVPSSLGFDFRQGAWDGYDTGSAAIVKTVYDTLQSIKPAGVVVALERQGE